MESALYYTIARKAEVGWMHHGVCFVLYYSKCDQVKALQRATEKVKPPYFLAFSSLYPIHSTTFKQLFLEEFDDLD